MEKTEEKVKVPKIKVDDEKLGQAIKLDTAVEGNVVKVTTAEGTYAKAVEEQVGIDPVSLENLNKFNTHYAKKAVTNLTDTLKEVYNSDKKVTEFEAEIEFIGAPIIGKGEKLISGEMNGKKWESTGMTIKHESYPIRGLKSIKKDLYEGINK